MGRRGVKKVRIIDANIDNLSHDLRGVSRDGGQVVFVEGGLPEESLKARILYKKSSYSSAVATEIISASPDRIQPKCEHSLFNEPLSICGGCSLQHISPENQLLFKQKKIAELLGLKADDFYPPIEGKAWGYRGKARLSAKFDSKNARVWVGFREKLSHRVARIKHCFVINEEVGKSLDELGLMLSELSDPRSVPQIEIATGELDSKPDIAIVIRHLNELSEDDIEKIRVFFLAKNWRVYLQSGGPETVKKMSLSEDDIRSSLLSYYFYDKKYDKHTHLQFFPLDFTQVNMDTNKKMIAQAMDWLCVGENDIVMDLFSGIGNFSIPMAHRAEYVLAVEGSEAMTKRVTSNASLNKLGNVASYVVDLYTEKGISGLNNIMQENKKINKVLLDPPRSGAKEVINFLIENNKIAQTSDDRGKVKKILYVSCNPSTFARDSQLLISAGMKLHKIGIMDMFPQTAHSEVMGLFEV